MRLKTVGIIFGVLSLGLFLFFLISDAIVMRNDAGGPNIGGFIFILPAAIGCAALAIGFVIGDRFVNRE